MIALLSVGGVHWILPQDLNFGPSWLVLVLVVICVTPSLAANRIKNKRILQFFGFAASGVVTLSLLASLVLLVVRLPGHHEQPIELIRSAALLWICNVLVFAGWYWRLDAGGPHQRSLRGAHTDGAFLFPQMTLSRELKSEMGEDKWSPLFVDYLFLAFNTSAAFSPTDTPVLSRWAKGLMMVQGTISLGTLALLAARAVNIL
jgi:hypothetical protein